MRTTTLFTLFSLACLGAKLEPGRLALESGNFAQAEKDFTTALAEAEKSGRKQDAVALLSNLGVVYRYQARYDRAEQMYLRALQSCNPNCESTLNSYAELLTAVGRYEEAGAMYLRAIRTRNPNWRIALQLQNIGDLSRRRGRYPEALALLNEARDLLVRTGHARSVEMASVLGSLGEYQIGLGQLRLAEPLLQQSADLYGETLGTSNANYAAALNNLGSLYFRQRKLAKAEPYYQRALSIHLKTNGREHPAIATDLNHLGTVAAARKQFPQAEHLFLEAVRIRERLGLASTPVDQMRTFANLADLYVSQKRYQDAEKWYERVMDMLDRYPNVDDVNIAVSIEQYAKLLAGQEQYALAEKLGTKAMKMRARRNVSVDNILHLPAPTLPQGLR